MSAIDLDTPVPAWYAAQRAGVTRQAFNYWRTAGKVQPAAGEGGEPLVDGRGQPLYRLRDVLQVEAQTRRSPQSRRGVPRPGAGRYATV